MTEFFDDTGDYVHDTADDGGGGLASLSEIDDNILSSFESIGTVYTTVGDIPATATVRPAGKFTQADSARAYLEQGGLVAVDTDGVTVIPMSFVYFLQEFDDILQEDTYTVYIDTET